MTYSASKPDCSNLSVCAFWLVVLTLASSNPLWRQHRASQIALALAAKLLASLLDKLHSVGAPLGRLSLGALSGRNSALQLLTASLANEPCLACRERLHMSAVKTTNVPGLSGGGLRLCGLLGRSLVQDLSGSPLL